MNLTQHLLNFDLKKINSDFTGIGIVVYKENIGLLPIVPLVKDSVLTEYITNELDIWNYLIAISRFEDRRHDGFHFVHITKGLTHISQFFSPPIPERYQPNNYDVGARYRASEIGSLLDGIIEIIVLTKNGTISVFNNGIEERIR